MNTRNCFIQQCTFLLWRFLLFCPSRLVKQERKQLMHSKWSLPTCKLTRFQQTYWMSQGATYSGRNWEAFEMSTDRPDSTEFRWLCWAYSPFPTLTLNVRKYSALSTKLGVSLICLWENSRKSADGERTPEWHLLWASLHREVSEAGKVSNRKITEKINCDPMEFSLIIVQDTDFAFGWVSKLVAKGKFLETKKTKEDCNKHEILW